MMYKDQIKEGPFYISVLFVIDEWIEDEQKLFLLFFVYLYQKEAYKLY